ncbi:butyrophilin subfamily 1 member A1-like isoform X49 [Oncorhynchus keta]|uniref:butyrophilin subfamily 1 member A1-like isoform X49 n=1 Tax=Oncorhynchus keta TaxID=8018 RepID=UPI00227AD7B8|nr:butyrophilin subfamily 1 member A1-like isoform X49 [Oncorhynchus keta]
MFTTFGNRGTMHLGLCLRVLILVALTVPIRAAQPAQETFTLTVPNGPTSTLSGSSVSLLCQVSPLFNVEPLEVRWYHSSNIHSPALLYKDHKIQETPVVPRYRGRVSLTGGMERGNVSLTLERVTLEDRGEYVCQVSSEQWYEKASVFLTVNVTGREPVLSVAEARGGGGGQVNVTCSSEGWSPQPKLTWRNKDGAEIRNEQEVLNTSDPQGLVSVSSWLLYACSYSDWLACTVSLSEEAKREGRILPHIYTAPTAVPGVYKEALIVTLILSLVIICALCSVILCKRRGSMWSSSQKSRNRSDQAELGQRPADQTELGKGPAETEHLIKGAENTVQTPTEQRAAGEEFNLEGAENTVQTPTEQRAAGEELNLNDWHHVKIFKVNILLDEKNAHPAIRINKGKRAHYVKEKDTEKPSRTHLHVFSEERFSSGQHYWEVKVKDGTTEKLSWYVGVARENVDKRPAVPLTPQNGFWILSYDKEQGFHVNTDPQPPITVAKLTIVGVFLDCDRHTLSFYNVDTKSLLYTFTDVKTSNYFPLLSPGRCDKIPIKIN